MRVEATKSATVPSKERPGAKEACVVGAAPAGILLPRMQGSARMMPEWSAILGEPAAQPQRPCTSVRPDPGSCRCRAKARQPTSGSLPRSVGIWRSPAEICRSSRKSRRCLSRPEGSGGARKLTNQPPSERRRRVRRSRGTRGRVANKSRVGVVGPKSRLNKMGTPEDETDHDFNVLGEADLQSRLDEAETREDQHVPE